MTTLINLFRDTLKDNETIAHFAITNFSQEHTVYKGVDTRNPPPSTHYPLIHLFPVSKQVGYDEEQVSHAVGISCGIYKESVTETNSEHGLLEEYAGIDLLESFRKLVETAVAAVIPAGSWISKLSIEYETIEFYPFLLAGMEITVVTPYHSGQDVFE
jgi:hypothetical protein